MTTEKITITAPNGMHARPAGELAKLVKSFSPTRISFSNGVKEVNAASMLSVLSLGLKSGSEIEVKADGGDEQAALKAVADFLKSITD